MLYALLFAASLLTDSMTVELSVPSHARAGAPVPLTVRITNRSRVAQTLYLRGRPIAFDVTITDDRGRKVWRRLEGATISMALQVREVAAGDALTLEDVWHQRTNAGVAVPPGEYRLTAEVLTDSAPLEAAPVVLRIDP